jgi:hypothetical protein
MRLHLISVYFIDVYLMGVYLTSVHLIGVYLTDVHLIGMYLMGVYSNLWGKAPHEATPQAKCKHQ